jgi:DNA invertase Pin-like site-specific DNA recombinase
VAYYRQSLQLPNVISLAIQQHQGRSWAQVHHVEILREFVDTDISESGSNNLPAFVAMLQWLQQRDDVRFILCSALSRIGRFPSQAADIARCGKQVVSVATTRFAPLDP